jgi:CO/xanthine dehydrogenase Mo-binding subunit
MDMIAERLGLDPVAFRRKNLLRDDDLFATGEKLVGMHYEELLDRAAASVNWTERDARWLATDRGTNNKVPLRRGKGLALVIKRRSLLQPLPRLSSSMKMAVSTS